MFCAHCLEVASVLLYLVYTCTRGSDSTLGGNGKRRVDLGLLSSVLHAHRTAPPPPFSRRRADCLPEIPSDIYSQMVGKHEHHMQQTQVGQRSLTFCFLFPCSLGRQHAYCYFSYHSYCCGSSVVLCFDRPMTAEGGEDEEGPSGRLRAGGNDPHRQRLSEDVTICSKMSSGRRRRVGATIGDGS